MFIILSDSTRRGLIIKMEDLERNFDIKSFDFSHDSEWYEVLVQFSRKPKSSLVKPQRGW